VPLPAEPPVPVEAEPEVETVPPDLALPEPPSDEPLLAGELVDREPAGSEAPEFDVCEPATAVPRTDTARSTALFVLGRACGTLATAG
jgi:hypothetical protein